MIHHYLLAIDKVYRLEKNRSLSTSDIILMLAFIVLTLSSSLSIFSTAKGSPTQGSVANIVSPARVVSSIAIAPAVPALNDLVTATVTTNATGTVVASYFWENRGQLCAVNGMMQQNANGQFTASFTVKWSGFWFIEVYTSQKVIFQGETQSTWLRVSFVYTDFTVPGSTDRCPQAELPVGGAKSQ